MLLELEAVRAGGRALQGTYGVSNSSKTTNKRIKELENQLAQFQGWDHGRQKGDPKAKAKSKGRPAQEPARRNVCWDEARGKGTCTRGDACRFSHDPQAIKEFIKGKGKGTDTHSQENELAKAGGKRTSSQGRAEGEGQGEGQRRDRESEVPGQALLRHPEGS